MIQPLFPVMMHDLGLNYHDFGNIAGVLAVAWGLSALFTGRLADRLGCRKILVPATVAFSVLACLSGFATGVLSLMLIRTVMGVAEGAFTPASIVATLQASKPTRHGLNLGIQQNAVALIGLGLAPIIVTQLLRLVPSWRWVFALVSIPGLVVAYLMYRTLRGDERATRSAPREEIVGSGYAWQDMFRYRNVPLNMGGMLCCLMILTVLGVFLPNYLIDVLHLDIQQMGLVVSAIGFGGSAGNLIMPGLSDRLGRKPVMLIDVILGVACLLGLAHAGANPTTLFLLIFFAMFFLFANITLTVGPVTVESVPPGLMATAAGIVVGTGEVFGGGVAPAIAGCVAQHAGIANILYLATVGMAMGVIVALALVETAPKRGDRRSASAQVASRRAVNPRTTNRELAAHTYARGPPPTIIGSLRVLEAKQLITRGPDLHDARKTVLRVTKRGADLKLIARNCAREIERMATGDFTTQQVAQFRQAVRIVRLTLRRNLKRYGSED